MFSNPRIAAKSFARLDERKGGAHSTKRTVHSADAPGDPAAIQQRLAP